MKINYLSKCLVELTGEVSRQQFDNALDEAFLKKQPTVEIKGFRKGHVTRELFQKHIGDETLVVDACDLAINKFLYEGITKYKVSPLNQPNVDVDFSKVKIHEPFNIKITFEVWPEVELGKYLGVEVKEEKKTVSDAKVKEHIDRTLKSYASLVLVEDDKPLEKGETAIIDFEGFLGKTAFEGGKGENHSLEIGSNSFIPGFEDQLIGMKKGETREIKVTFPENYHAENLKGKEATFKVTLHEIKKREIPEITDDFVKSLEIEGVTKVSEYKKHVKDTLLKETEEASTNKFNSDVLEKVVGDSKTDVPETLVENELKYHLNYFEKQASTYKISVEDLLKMYGIESLEKHKELMRPGIINTVKTRIVLYAISEQEKLKYTDKDYEKDLEEISKEQEKPLEEIKKLYPKHQIEGYALIQKAQKLVLDKAIKK